MPSQYHTLCDIGFVTLCVTLYSTVLNSVWGQQMEALYKVLMCEKLKVFLTQA